jgi:hypothetical protein
VGKTRFLSENEHLYGKRTPLEQPHCTFAEKALWRGAPLEFLNHAGAIALQKILLLREIPGGSALGWTTLLKCSMCKGTKDLSNKTISLGLINLVRLSF